MFYINIFVKSWYPHIEEQNTPDDHRKSPLSISTIQVDLHVLNPDTEI